MHSIAARHRSIPSCMHLHGRQQRKVVFHRCMSSTQTGGIESSQPELAAKPAYPTFQILYQDEHIVAIDKPSGFHVHPPEDGRTIPINENCLYLLKKQLGGKWLYPVHRLDRPTSGVVVYCLSSTAASSFGQSVRSREIHKIYYAMVRGYTDSTGVINDTVGGAESCTQYETIARVKVPLAVAKFPSARYSLVRVKPLTGRFHQIRRHLNYISHPIVGDSDHGDRYHNRAWSGQLQTPGMFLKAASIEFDHPMTGQRMLIHAQQWEPKWHKAFSMFGVSPMVGNDTGMLEFQGDGTSGVRAALQGQHGNGAEFVHERVPSWGTVPQVLSPGEVLAEA